MKILLLSLLLSLALLCLVYYVGGRIGEALYWHDYYHNYSEFPVTLTDGTTVMLKNVPLGQQPKTGTYGLPLPYNEWGDCMSGCFPIWKPWNIIIDFFIWFNLIYIFLRRKSLLKKLKGVSLKDSPKIAAYLIITSLVIFIIKMLFEFKSLAN